MPTQKDLKAWKPRSVFKKRNDKIVIDALSGKYTLHQIAEKYGVCYTRIHQLKASAQAFLNPPAAKENE